MSKIIEEQKITLTNFIDCFIDFLNNEKKSSKNTIDAYIRDLGNFKSHIDRSDVSSFEDINVDFLEG